MTDIELPTLVLALYNRKEPTLRCLESLSAAVYPGKQITLVISIDNDDGKNMDILELAKNYQWEHGDKDVIFHENKLGLRDHFNYCGDLTQKYGSVIFLEDDLFVSKYYYDYAIQALKFYKGSEHIAGISLFSYNVLDQSENSRPFSAVDDGSDNYFLQQASWGQIWTSEIWRNYKKWFKKYGNKEYVNSLPEVPFAIKQWPGDRSWKKYFIAWMILHSKYYVFPRVALATNFDDMGTNRKGGSFDFQSPLLIKEKKFKFSTFDESLSIYDSYFEILPHILKFLNPELSKFDFEVNLYGDKNPEDIKKDIILSSVPGKKNIKQYGRFMKPHELNIIYSIEGNRIFLASKKGLKKNNKVDKFIEDFEYFYRRIFNLKEILKIVIYKIKHKF